MGAVGVGAWVYNPTFRQEVVRNGDSAIQNRLSLAAMAREDGREEAAQQLEEQAEEARQILNEKRRS